MKSETTSITFLPICGHRMFPSFSACTLPQGHSGFHSHNPSFCHEMIKEEIAAWTKMADVEDSPLGGNVVKAATYRGTAAGLKIAEQFIVMCESR